MKCSAYLLQKKPRSFQCNANIRRKLSGGYSFLVISHEIHSKKPFTQRNLCILKDCTDTDIEILTSVFTAVIAIATLIHLGTYIVW